MYGGLTEKEAEIARKFESMSEEEMDAFDREAEEDGRVCHGRGGLDAAFKVLFERRKKMVSMRLPPEVVQGLKDKAARVGIPYQTLAASVLKRYVEGKLDIEAA